MKLAIYYLNKVGFAGDLQSFVSLFFFLLFVFILYIIFTGNKKVYKAYGDLPFEDENFDNLGSQNKKQ
ncbi:MAG: CcoQ/FixQ family Cbb3-type cytochrome c oxidase assembly chaperone [Bacteroidales bacterium]|nr:CcoQ/FixQ family Cbb3-type cytochrome c oxidase assembly chaperone [Bacteroidales bacterium]